MTPRELSIRVITLRLEMMREFLSYLDDVAPESGFDLASDLVRRLATERILTQLVSFAVDINQHVAAAVGRVPVSDFAESFDAAGRVGLITAELAAELRPSAGLRDVLIHEYLDVDLRKVSAAVPLARAGYREDVYQVADWLASAA